MKIAKSLLTGTGSLVVAGLVLSLLAPKAVHAIVATAVQVVNTAAAPVMVNSINEPGRTPYQAEAGNLSCLGQGNCNYTFLPIPANHRLVVQQIGGYLGSNLASPAGRVQFGNLGFNAAGSFFTAPFLGYLDGTSTPTISVILNGADTMNGFGNITITGYLVDCTAVNCAAVVTQ